MWILVSIPFWIVGAILWFLSLMAAVQIIRSKCRYLFEDLQYATSMLVFSGLAFAIAAKLVS